MTTEELADYIKEKFSLTDEDLIKYCEIIQNGLELMSTR